MLYSPQTSAKAALGESESLDGLDVLPCFSCPVREVFGA